MRHLREHVCELLYFECMNFAPHTAQTASTILLPFAAAFLCLHRVEQTVECALWFSYSHPHTSQTWRNVFVMTLERPVCFCAVYLILHSGEQTFFDSHRFFVKVSPQIGQTASTTGL